MMILDADAVRSALAAIDWPVVVAEAAHRAEGTCPGLAYMNFDGQVGYAETMCEVEGMPLCIIYEDECVGVPFDWILAVDASAQSAVLSALLTAGYATAD